MHVKTGSNDLVYHKNECNDNSLNSHCNIAVLERLVSIIVHHLPHYLWASLDAKATLWHAQWIWVINGLFSFCSFILTLFWCHHHMCTGWSKSSDFIKVSIFWSMHLLHRKDDSLCGASMNLKKKISLQHFLFDNSQVHNQFPANSHINNHPEKSASLPCLLITESFETNALYMS